MSTFQQIYDLVSQIPRGRVSTYGNIAKKIGIRNVQVVGFALHQNKDTLRVPCHRVVKKDGFLANGYAFGGIDKQKELLIQEGVDFLNDSQINMIKSYFCFD